MLAGIIQTLCIVIVTAELNKHASKYHVDELTELADGTLGDAISPRTAMFISKPSNRLAVKRHDFLKLFQSRRISTVPKTFNSDERKNNARKIIIKQKKFAKSLPNVSSKNFEKSTVRKRQFDRVTPFEQLYLDATNHTKSQNNFFYHGKSILFSNRKEKAKIKYKTKRTFIAKPKDHSEGTQVFVEFDENSEDSSSSKRSRIEEPIDKRGYTIILNNNGNDENEAKKEQIYRELKEHFSEMEDHFQNFGVPENKKMVRVLVISEKNATVGKNERGEERDNLPEPEIQAKFVPLSDLQYVDRETPLDIDIDKLRHMKEKFSVLNDDDIASMEGRGATIKPSETSTKPSSLSKKSLTDAEEQIKFLDNISNDVRSNTKKSNTTSQINRFHPRDPDREETVVREESDNLMLTNQIDEAGGKHNETVDKTHFHFKLKLLRGSDIYSKEPLAYNNTNLVTVMNKSDEETLPKVKSEDSLSNHTIKQSEFNSKNSDEMNDNKDTATASNKKHEILLKQNSQADLKETTTTSKHFMPPENPSPSRKESMATTPSPAYHITHTTTISTTQKGTTTKHSKKITDPLKGSSSNVLHKRKAEAIVEFLNKDPLDSWRYQFHTLKSLDLNSTILRSGLVNAGNIDRLKGVMRRALEGKDIKLTIVGGSISAGGGLYKDRGNIDGLYYKGVVDWWNKMITPLTGSDMIVNNVAIGSIGTDYFSYCLKNHVALETDIILWELAANDYNRYKMQPTKGARPLERLTRMALELPNKPALVYVNFFKGVDYKATRESCPNFEDQGEDIIAHYYKIPSLSWRAMVCGGLLRGDQGYKIENLFSLDQYHPSLRGHAQMSLLLLLHLRHVMRSVLQWAIEHNGSIERFEDKYNLPEPLFMGPKYPDPLCWTLITADLSERITNSLKVKVVKQLGFKMEYATNFPIRFDKVICWKAERSDSELAIQFYIPEKYGLEGEKRSKSEVAITTHTRWGGSSTIWVDAMREKQIVIKEGRPNDPGKRTQVDSIISDIGPGTHTLNVLSHEGAFCLAAIMIDGS